MCPVSLLAVLGYTGNGPSHSGMMLSGESQGHNLCPKLCSQLHMVEIFPLGNHIPSFIPRCAMQSKYWLKPGRENAGLALRPT